MVDKIKKLSKEKIDYIKANWDIPETFDIFGEPEELPEIQQLIIDLLLRIEELEERIIELEKGR